MATTLFPTRFRWGISIPDHSANCYEHANYHLYVETFFPKEQESQYQNEYCFHMTDNLEWNSSESSNAYELAEIGAYCYSAWKNDECLQRKSYYISVRYHV